MVIGLLGTTPAEATVMGSALTRQAIYDANLHAWAYELRYVLPEAVSLHTPPAAAEAHTSAVILAAFAEFGLERVVGKKKAFIDASTSVVTGQLPLPIPAHRVALQVRTEQHGAIDLVHAFRAWKDQGFDIALDDFVMREAELPLLDLVDYVKLSYVRLGDAGMAEHRELLRRYHVEPIATELSSSAAVRRCEAMGFVSFQGDFLFKPQLLQRKELPASFVIVSDLMSKLQDPDVNFSEIEDVVKRDAGLSVAVLRFLNSGAYAFRQQVSSVTQAVSLLGLNEFMKWTLLVVFSTRFETPSELMTTALVRARTCENYARATNGAAPGTAFMVGLLSVLDAILAQPMEQILEELPLTPEVRAAVMEFAGPAGAILESVVARETHTAELSSEQQAVLTRAWLNAIEWADRTRGTLLHRN